MRPTRSRDEWCAPRSVLNAADGRMDPGDLGGSGREVRRWRHSGYYAVRSQGVEYVITGPAHLEEMSSWGRATFALFDIVNRQLQNSPRKFYAVYGGNELGGIFLTEAEYRAARRGTPERRYWPYLPVNEEPDFGAPE